MWSICQMLRTWKSALLGLLREPPLVRQTTAHGDHAPYPPSTTPRTRSPISSSGTSRACKRPM